MNIKHILEGIGNTLFVKEEVEKIAADRLLVCRTCPRNSFNKDKEFFDPAKYYAAIRPDEHCSVCACNIHAKVRSLHTACPEKKWDAVATEEEAVKIAVAADKTD